MQMSRAALLLAQEVAHWIWQDYDDAYGYRTEKQDRNNAVNLEDPDVMWFFWNQFDGNNQRKFTKLVEDELPRPEANELVKWIHQVGITGVML